MLTSFSVQAKTQCLQPCFLLPIASPGLLLCPVASFAGCALGFVWPSSFNYKMDAAAPRWTLGRYAREALRRSHASTASPSTASRTSVTVSVTVDGNGSDGQVTELQMSMARCNVIDDDGEQVVKTSRSDEYEVAPRGHIVKRGFESDARDSVSRYRKLDHQFESKEMCQVWVGGVDNDTVWFKGGTTAWCRFNSDPFWTCGRYWNQQGKRARKFEEWDEQHVKAWEQVLVGGIDEQIMWLPKKNEIWAKYQSH